MKVKEYSKNMIKQSVNAGEKRDCAVLSIAAAFVNPTITGCERKSTITHNLRLHMSK